MALPSVAKRLNEFEDDIDRLLDWDSHMPSSALWRDRLNELRFVRATLGWETFLEESAICFVRGARSLSGTAHGLSAPVPGNRARALTQILAGAQFGHWLNETWTLQTTAALFSGTNPYQIVAAPVFRDIRQVRNRIVHRSEQARKGFRSVVNSVVGSQPPGMTPGRLLVTKPYGSPLVDHYLKVLKASARAICA